MLRVFVVAVTIALGACSSNKTPSGTPEASITQSPEGEVAVARVDGGTRLTNGTDRALAYIVRNPAWLGLVALCIDTGPTCVRLAPGASVVVPDAEILGHGPGAREAQVSVWRVETDPAGGYRAVIVKEVTLRL
jgi:hypothetical protein